MRRLSRVALLVVGVLALGVAFTPATVALATDKPAPSGPGVASLGSGEFTISVSVPEPKVLHLRITTSLAGVGAILLDAAATGEHLAMITTSAGARLAEPHIKLEPVLAKATIDLSDLQDLDMTFSVAFDASDVRALNLKLIRNDGLMIPFTLGVTPAVGAQLSFRFAGTQCYTLTGSCGAIGTCPACTTPSITCCPPPRAGGCIYCPSCILACPPCFPDSGGGCIQ